MWPKVKLLFLPDRNQQEHPTLLLEVGDINSTDQIKFLEVTLDKNVNFKQHIIAVLNKMSKSVGVMYRLNQYLPSQTLLSIYYSLVYPYLGYGVESWYSVTKTMSEKVQILQKKYIWSIFKVPYNGSTRTYFKEINILQLPEVCKFKLYSTFAKYKKYGVSSIIIFQITCIWIQTSIVKISAYVKTFQFPISGDQCLKPVSFSRALTTVVPYLRIWSKKRIKPISINLCGNTLFLQNEYLKTRFTYTILIEFYSTGLPVTVLVFQCWISENAFYWYDTSFLLHCIIYICHNGYNLTKMEKNIYTKWVTLRFFI